MYPQELIPKLKIEILHSKVYSLLQKRGKRTTYLGSGTSSARSGPTRCDVWTSPVLLDTSSLTFPLKRGLPGGMSQPPCTQKREFLTSPRFVLFYIPFGGPQTSGLFRGTRGAQIFTHFQGLNDKGSHGFAQPKRVKTTTRHHRVRS